MCDRSDEEPWIECALGAWETKTGKKSVCSSQLRKSSPAGVPLQDQDRDQEDHADDTSPPPPSPIHVDSGGAGVARGSHKSFYNPNKVGRGVSGGYGSVLVEQGRSDSMSHDDDVDHTQMGAKRFFSDIDDLAEEAMSSPHKQLSPLCSESTEEATVKTTSPVAESSGTTVTAKSPVEQSTASKPESSAPHPSAHPNKPTSLV